MKISDYDATLESNNDGGDSDDTDDDKDDDVDEQCRGRSNAKREDLI